MNRFGMGKEAVGRTLQTGTNICKSTEENTAYVLAAQRTEGTGTYPCPEVKPEPVETHDHTSTL